MKLLIILLVFVIVLVAGCVQVPPTKPNSSSSPSTVKPSIQTNVSGQLNSTNVSPPASSVNITQQANKTNLSDDGLDEALDILSELENASK
ncbi:hypothetical protein HZC07_00865 [Candidatus Micrarchaeota archaeon]|nr:hypothetical protein [Candidatus Micrarchaeota archaeon]